MYTYSHFCLSLVVTQAKFTDDEQALAEVESTIPMGRLGKPTELTGAVLFLASASSSYMTGGDIVVDGGFVAV